MRHPTKMIIVFSLLTLFYLGFGAIMNWQITHIAGLVEEVEKHPLAARRGILTANRDSIAISRNVKDMILVTSFEHRRSRLTEIELYEKSIKESMTLVYERIVGEEGKNLTKSAMELLDRQVELRRQITDAIFANENQLAAELARIEGTAIMKKIEDLMEKIVHYVETQSMEYQVESMSALKRSKVILFSAGLIIAILSLVFTLAIEVPLLSSLNQTHEKIKLSTSSDSLGHVFHTPSPMKINEALNGLFVKIKERVGEIHRQHTVLDEQLTSLKLDEDNIPIYFDQIIAKLDPILDKLGTFSGQHAQNQQGSHTILNSLAQTRGDFTVIAQMMASEDLLLDQFNFSGISDETKMQVEKLRSNNKSLQQSIQKSSQAIAVIADLFQILMTRFTELKSVAIANKDLLLEIKNLRKQFSLCEQKLSQLKETSSQLKDAIEEIKLS